MKLLEEDGAEVEYYDPNVSEISWNGGTKKGLQSISDKSISSFHAIIILADHSDVDYKLILTNAALIVDSRNVYSDEKDEKIIRLGVGKRNNH